MNKTCKSKRVLAILMTLMMIFSLSFSVFADATQEKQDGGGVMGLRVMYVFFNVRASGSYADIGDAYLVAYEFFPGLFAADHIELDSKVTFKASNGKKVTLPKGTTWDISISDSDFKDGGKITLTFNKKDSPDSAASIVKKYKMETMTGKIHIDKKRNSTCFWKIDCLGCGFYFRDT